MQSGRNAAEAVKESAANVGASAKAGMEKTKATAQEKVLIFFFSYLFIKFQVAHMFGRFCHMTNFLFFLFFWETLVLREN